MFPPRCAVLERAVLSADLSSVPHSSGGDEAADSASTRRRIFSGKSGSRSAENTDWNHSRTPPPPISHPPTPVRPSVCLSAEFLTVLTSDCRRLRGAHRGGGEASYPPATFPSSAQLNKRSGSEVSRLSPPPPPCKLFRTVDPVGGVGWGGDATLEGEAAGGRCPHFIR